MATDPDRDETDERIERMERELEEQAKSLFTDAPDPGPIPQVLRDPPPAPRTPISTPARGGGTGAALGRAFAIATNFVVAVAVMGVLGWLVDRWRGTEPWFTLAGLGVGLVVGFYRFVKEALAASRQGFGDRREP